MVVVGKVDVGRQSRRTEARRRTRRYRNEGGDPARVDRRTDVRRSVLHHVGGGVLTTDHQATEAALDEGVVLVDLVARLEGLKLNLHTEGDAVVKRRRTLEVNLAVGEEARVSVKSRGSLLDSS